MKQLLVIALLAMSIGMAGCQRAYTPTVQAQDATEASESKPVHTCAGMTKKGEKCKRRVKNEGDYCFMHKDQDTRKK
jgi:hypothetical protein